MYMYEARSSILVQVIFWCFIACGLFYSAHAICENQRSGAMAALGIIFVSLFMLRSRRTYFVLIVTASILPFLCFGQMLLDARNALVVFVALLWFICVIVANFFSPSRRKDADRHV